MLFGSFFLKSFRGTVRMLTGLLTPNSVVNLPTAASEGFIHITPDGTSLYVDSTHQNNQLYQFNRDPSTGSLTMIGTGIVGSGVLNWSTGRSMAISPDNNNVYVACHNSDAVYEYTRDTSTGALTLMGTPLAIGCTSVAISNDGRFAYIPHVDSSFIRIAPRNTSTGTLNITGAGVTTPVTQPENLILSPNGNYLYVYTQSHTTLCQFSVDTSTGALAALSPSIFDAGAGMTPYAMVFTPDGVFAYVANSNVVMTLGVASNGQLSFISSTTVTGAIYQLSISLDGQNLYMSTMSHNIYQFNINSSTGQLTPLIPAYIVTTTSAIGNGISPDGKNFYTSAVDSKIYCYTRN
jgi:6-phosphogluconolactonase (cycloisomerase 2 family)